MRVGPEVPTLLCVSPNVHDRASGGVEPEVWGLSLRLGIPAWNRQSAPGVTEIKQEARSRDLESRAAHSSWQQATACSLHKPAPSHHHHHGDLSLAVASRASPPRAAHAAAAPPLHPSLGRSAAWDPPRLIHIFILLEVIYDLALPTRKRTSERRHCVLLTAITCVTCEEPQQSLSQEGCRELR